tara:strand:- start:2366 stop:2518 length:153 start_codon:yes stop_codon:yes gene_type:complete
MITNFYEKCEENEVLFNWFSDHMSDVMEMAGWNTKDKSPINLPKKVTIKI